MYLLVPVPSRLHGLSGYVLVPTLANSARGTLGDWDALPRIAQTLVAWLKSALARLGIENYSRHSFRIGAATTATTVGIPDHLIKTM